MLRRRHALPGLVLVPALVLLVACTGSPSTPAQTSVPGPVSSSRATPSGSVTSVPSSTAPSADAAASRPARSKAGLKKALLTLDDLPAGFSIEPVEDVDGDAPVISSKNPRCKDLVEIMNADHAPGALASATTSYSGGQDGPWIDEYLDALGSHDRVTALHARIRKAVEACPKVTLRLPEGRSTMVVRAVKAPGADKESVAFRVTADGGDLEGFEAAQVVTAIDDVELTMMFFNAYPDEIEDGTLAALHKARAELSGKGALTS